MYKFFCIQVIFIIQLWLKTHSESLVSRILGIGPNLSDDLPEIRPFFSVPVEFVRTRFHLKWWTNPFLSPAYVYEFHKFNVFKYQRATLSKKVLYNNVLYTLHPPPNCTEQKPSLLFIKNWCCIRNCFLSLNVLPTCRKVPCLSEIKQFCVQEQSSVTLAI